MGSEMCIRDSFKLLNWTFNNFWTDFKDWFCVVTGFMLDDLGEGICDDETQVVGEGQRHIRGVHHGQVAPVVSSVNVGGSTATI